LAASLKVPSNFVSVTAHAIGLLIEHHLDVPFSDLQLVLLYDVEWTLDATSVSEKPDFAFLEIANDRYLSFDATVSPKGLEILEEAMSVTCEADPVSIDEHFCLFCATQIFSRELFKLLNAPVLKLVNNVC